MSKELSKMTVVELKELLKEKGLPTDGKKAELIDRLQSAKEDEILETPTENNNADAKSDSIDEDAILGETNLKEIEPTKTEGKEKEGNDASKEETKEPVNQEERKIARAQRFGLPLSVEDAKAKRAQRFGLSSPVSATSPATSPTTPTPKPAVSDEQKQKLIQRAARFGLPVNSEGKVTHNGSSAGPELEKLEARSKRFGSTNSDVEAELKKKARLERFGATAAN